MLAAKPLRGPSETSTGSAARPRSVAARLADAEAVRYAVHVVMPEVDRELAAGLIQKRYRMSARRARRILGLPSR